MSCADRRTYSYSKINAAFDSATGYRHAADPLLSSQYSYCCPPRGCKRHISLDRARINRNAVSQQILKCQKSFR